MPTNFPQSARFHLMWLDPTTSKRNAIGNKDRAGLTLDQLKYMFSVFLPNNEFPDLETGDFAVLGTAKFTDADGVTYRGTIARIR